MTTKTSTESSLFTIAATYLMWIGSEHYSSIIDWTKEALEKGVSKRLPNDHVGRALLQPGTVVFVAHDEGKHAPCFECAGTVECPECRKNAEAVARETATVERFLEEANTYEEGSKERKSCERRANNAQKRIEKHDDAQSNCELCLGSGSVEEGTGGNVVFENGEAWDYRKYMYYRNQPKKWTPATEGGVAKMEMCQHCGGFGRLPEGKVFGLFVPEQVEYVDAGDEEKTKAMLDKGFTVIDASMLAAEAKRGCGVRKPGGVYATTTPDSESTSGAKAAEALKLDNADIEAKGNFVAFTRSIDISGTKRFRGLARWDMPADVEEEAEMIAEAME